ncbi:helix-turn-helix transcriptional regulator [Psychrobacter sp. F1192]|uniref:Helix-turn-helix transcriptional regulator n=1 Tax=Psychrobacter coccoides TaxID=2818440 RepID=A0ABS3NL09_9GAMM|nr:helix-turn-helix transcriptional regulator [Psychrobacter coccoides]MBO1530102.1 helix-turn-helix transcriptional regulator [Psychrobacter coccoides]
MIETGHSTHKSIMIAIREAAALYLFNRSREKDIPKIAEVFLSLENYEGERVPITEVVKEVHAISNVLQDNYLGLHLNLLVDIESLPFYKAISECIKPFSNVNSELPFLLVGRLVFHFFFLMTQSIDLKLTLKKEQLRFDFASNASEVMNKNQIDGAMVLVYRLLEAFCPGRLKGVCVAHRYTSYELEYYQSIFGVPAKLAATTSLVYDLKCSNHYKNATYLLTSSEQRLGRKFLINPLLNMLSIQFADLSYQQRCEIILNTVMGVSVPTRRHVADSMNISVSTLQRRLKEEGTSFHEVLEATRKQMAKLYLIEKKLSTTDIAHLLGYKSHSQFFKAFKAWFGMTPKAYQVSLIESIETEPIKNEHH